MLLVILQTHSKGDNHIYEGYLPPEHKRYTGASKLETSKRCVRSLINSLNNFSKIAPDFPIELQIFDDHSDQEYLEILKRDIDKAFFKVNITNLVETGISASMLACYQYGRQHGKELVYFAQDDYLYEDNAIEEMAEFFYQLSPKLDKPLAVYPFNDPYRYAPFNIHPVRIVQGSKRYWRQNFATAFPFMVHHSVLVKEFDVFYGMGIHKINNKMEDETINKLFQERGYCLFTPIPSLSFHMQYETERDPFVDYRPLWNKFADDNVKDYSKLFQNENKKVLNIGANKAKLDFKLFENYQEIKLDICDDVSPDIVASITNMESIPSQSVDGIWASHIVEHIFWHELPAAFFGIKRILKDDGIAIIMVPNLALIADNLKDDVNKVLYDTPSGPITALDMIYGFRKFTKLGMDGMMHKIGFTPRLMGEVLDSCKLKYKIYSYNFDIVAVIGNIEDYSVVEKSLESYYWN
jgi:predicted SAM-dependent methyltransferase